MDSIGPLTSALGVLADVCGSCDCPVSSDGRRTCRLLAARSPAMRRTVKRALVVALTSAPIVLLGETGSGKEVLARAIHFASPRHARPFVPVNCAAIPNELLESELFGHARGAFSGAIADKPGLFEAAAGGTLLLDEIGDLPPLLQVKLLRVLQDGQVRRVGSNLSIATDVRVIAATHRDLASLVESGAFRADLYYRLNVFSLRIPALRDRREDIVPLARQLLERERPPRQLAPAAEELLWRYHWPGNVRELSNVVRYAAAMADGPFVHAHHLPEGIARAHTAATPPPGAYRTLAEVEEEHVLAVLQACHGVQAAAAKILGIGRNTLWRKLSRYGNRILADEPGPEDGAAE
jgi:two-component system response regulator HydG